MFVVCLLLTFRSPVVFQGRSVCQGLLQTGHGPSVWDGSPGQSSTLLLQFPLIPAALGSSLSPLLSSQVGDMSSSNLWVCQSPGPHSAGLPLPLWVEGALLFFLPTAWRSRGTSINCSQIEYLPGSSICQRCSYRICFYLLHTEYNLSHFPVKAQCYL